MTYDSKAIAERVQENLAEPLSDLNELVRALDQIDPGLERRGWKMNEVQRLALGTHLAAAIKRFATGELVAEIDASLLSQVSEDATNMAGEILAVIQKTPEIQPEEKFLVAVHLDSAQL
ncbi:MAG: PRD domain-containing protein [Tessaracoccus sp.]